MTWRIRLAEFDDAEAMARLFYETVRTVNVRDYTEEQVRAWAPHPRSAEEMRRRQQGKQVWVAEDQGRLVGFAELDPDGHLDCFYCHKDYQGVGVGKELFAALASHARRQGLGRLLAEVSITARPFFEKQGFRVVREQQVERRGVRLTNYVMERVEASSEPSDADRTQNGVG